MLHNSFFSCYGLEESKRTPSMNFLDIDLWLSTTFRDMPANYRVLIPLQLTLLDIENQIKGNSKYNILARGADLNLKLLVVQSQFDRKSLIFCFYRSLRQWQIYLFL